MEIFVRENIYGHRKRLKWIIEKLHPDDTIIELGSGTGLMITLPLAKLGYNIFGIDLDERSIAYGSKLFEQDGLDPNTLKTIDFEKLDIMIDVVIASEVLEHLPDDILNSMLRSINMKLKPGGKLLVTVPNGYGWFETESFVWNKLFLGRCLERFGLVFIIAGLKQLLFGENIEPIHPSTLSPSPHVQRFTLRNIQDRLIEYGFDILDVQGSVLFCGQFSNLFFTGIKPIMRLNTWLGSKLMPIASSFYIAARKR